MNALQARIEELIASNDGNLRLTARLLDIDGGYLHHLRRGRMSNPREAVLKKLGLRRVVTVQYIKIGV